MGSLGSDSNVIPWAEVNFDGVMEKEVFREPSNGTTGLVGHEGSGAQHADRGWQVAQDVTAVIISHSPVGGITVTTHHLTSQAPLRLEGNADRTPATREASSVGRSLSGMETSFRAKLCRNHFKYFRKNK